MNPIQREINKKIKEFNTIIIHRHQLPDPDALGAQGGLQKAIQHSYPNKKVYVVGEEEARLKFMISMDTVEDDQYKDALVIVVDTATSERISDPRFSKGKFIIKIDHHPDREAYGELNWVDTAFSSTSEMIYELVQESTDLRLTDDAAKLLFSGIVGDTGRFQYPNTTEQTMRYTSELLRFNFRPQDFYNKFYKESRNVALLKGLVLVEHKVTTNGVAHFIITEELMNKYGVTPFEAANLISCLSDIEGNRIWALFIQTKEGYRSRVRSKRVDVNDIIKPFGGGGHKLAAGALLKDLESVEKLIKSLDEQMTIL